MLHERGAGTVSCVNKPLPRGSVIAVSGVSFRQDQVQCMSVGDQITFEHDFSNPHDQQAVRILNTEGSLLGYVPAKGGIAARLAGTQQGGIWSGEVNEVLVGQTYGLRVRLGALIRTVDTTIGSNNAGIRETEEDTHCVPQAVEIKTTVGVTTVTGRYIGELVEVAGGTVRVCKDGNITAWPAGVVNVAHSAA